MKLEPSAVGCREGGMAESRVWVRVRDVLHPNLRGRIFARLQNNVRTRTSVRMCYRIYRYLREGGLG